MQLLHWKLLHPDNCGLAAGFLIIRLLAISMQHGIPVIVSRLWQQRFVQRQLLRNIIILVIHFHWNRRQRFFFWRILFPSFLHWRRQPHGPVRALLLPACRRSHSSRLRSTPLNRSLLNRGGSVKAGPMR